MRDAVPAPDAGSYHFVTQTTEPDCCQLKMIFVDGPIYFGAVDHVQRRLHGVDAANPDHKHLLILAPGINFIDSSGAEILSQEARRRRAAGGALYFHRLQPAVVDTLERSGRMPDIGHDRLYAIGEDVIGAIYPQLDSQVCRTCPSRIFRQCQGPLPNGEPRHAAPATRPRTTYLRPEH